MNPHFIQGLRRDPVVVTGLGAITAAGRSVQALSSALRQNHSPARWATEAGMIEGQYSAACQCENVDLPGPSFRRARKMDRSVQLALIAAEEAWRHGQMQERPADPWRIGTVVGTSRGPIEKWTESLGRLSKNAMIPSLAANCAIGALSGAISQAFGLKAPSFAVSAACASSATAISLGALQILSGAADCVLAGGAEAPLHPAVFAQLRAAGVLGFHHDARETCRPFDLTRNGTVLGEGAAFLLLESESSARKRGATIFARLAGWGVASEAATRSGIEESGETLHRAMRQALDMAGLDPRELDYINAHGTGTMLNDRVEANAVERLLGKAKESVAFSSTKPVTGHCMGAAAAIEAIITILALKEQWVPPTVNCLNPDPECRLRLILKEGERQSVRCALTNSSGFWGNHASLVFTLP